MSDWNMYYTLTEGKITNENTGTYYAAFGAIEPMGQRVKYIPLHSSEQMRKGNGEKRQTKVRD